MPFDVKCDGCGRQFRAPDKLGGKRVKCPQCQSVILVGAAPADQTPPQPAPQPKSQPKSQPAPTPRPQAKAAAGKPAGQAQPAQAQPVQQVPSAQSTDVAEWHMQTGDGEEYGPVTKAELDGWVVEGRLDRNCQVLQDGWDQWRWADDVYPQLAEPAAPEPEPEDAFAIIGGGAPPPDPGPFITPDDAPVATPISPSAEPSAITPRLRRALADTKPWVVFLAILGFVVGGCWLLLALWQIATGLALLRTATGTETIGATGAVMALTFSVEPVLYLITAYLLFRYATRIGEFLGSTETRQLERAIEAQRVFWMWVGIVTLVNLLIVLLLIVAAFAFAGAVFGGGRESSSMSAPNAGFSCAAAIADLQKRLPTPLR